MCARRSAHNRWLRRALFGFAIVTGVVCGVTGFYISEQYKSNVRCCVVPPARNLLVSVRETLGLETFESQIGQDKWVLHTVYPNLKNGFFVDVGSGDGTIASNTKALERRGWTGLCIDPFPTNMQDRTCRVFKEVVYSRPGDRVTFHASGALGGIAETLGAWKEVASRAPSVEFTTVTLGDILARARAPHFIQFMSLDIEGAELDALRAFPFDSFTVGALAVEHNSEEPKRTDIEALLRHHGYRRVHAWQQDDFYVSTTSDRKVAGGQ